MNNITVQFTREEKDPRVCSFPQCSQRRDSMGEFTICLGHYLVMTKSEREIYRLKGVR